MNLQRFRSQLRREVKAHPGKAALLGVLLVVALYYWIPLMGKWFSSSESLAAVRVQPAASAGLVATSEKNPPAFLGGSVAGSTPSPPSGKNAEAFPSWEQLVQWRKEDPRTRAVPWPNARRDPFQPAPATPFAEGKDSPAAKTALDGNSAKSPNPQEPPETLEIELTSITIGPNRRVALINGRPYQEGSSFVCTKEGQQWQFRLTRILPTKILLQWKDRYYEVKLPQSPSNVEIQIVSSPQNESP